MTIYIYSNETGCQVDAIDGPDNAECERLANEKWSSNDYHWSYKDVPVSNAVSVIDMRAALSGHDVTIRRLSRGTIQLRVQKDGTHIFTLELDDTAAEKVGDALIRITAHDQTNYSESVKQD
jgi:hypothetical protein